MFRKKVAAGFFTSIAVFLLLSACILPTAPEEFPDSLIMPPPWIIGTWIDDSGTGTLTFSRTNFILAEQGLMSINYAEAFKMARVTDQLTMNDYYSIRVQTSDNIQISEFRKTSATTLRYSLTTNGVTTGPTTYTRR